MPLIPALLLATTIAAPIPPPPRRVSLAYAEERDAAGRAVHDREEVIVTGIASVGSDLLQRGALKFFIQDRTAAPYGLALYTNRLHMRIAAGDVVVARGRLSMYASSIELLPDELKVIEKAKPPAPVDVPAEQVVGQRWAGVLVRTRAAVENVQREEDYINIRLTTSRGPIFGYIAPAQMKMFDAESIVKGVTLEVTGIASEYQRRTSSGPEWELLPRQPSDLRVVTSSRSALLTTIGVAAVAVLLIAAAIVFSRPQKIRPEQYP